MLILSNANGYDKQCWCWAISNNGALQLTSYYVESCAAPLFDSGAIVARLRNGGSSVRTWCGEATTHGESCALYNCPMIVLRGQPAGSCAPMVLNYSRCVVLGFGPAKLGTTWIIQQQEVELAVMAYWGLT